MPDTMPRKNGALCYTTSLANDVVYWSHMAYTPEFLEKIAQAQDLFVWEAPAWEHQERHPHWYLWMSLVALGFAAYAVFTGNYLFAFIIFLIAIILVLAGNEGPHTMLVQVGVNGVVIDGRLFLYDDLHEFAIIYHPPETKVMYLEPKSYVKGRIRVPLVDQDPVSLRDHLKQFLEEDLDLRDEHISDIFGRLLKI